MLVCPKCDCCREVAVVEKRLLVEVTLYDVYALGINV